MKSKMKLTDHLQDWVTEEVLPSIRKHGAYKLIDDNQFLKNENAQLEFKLKALFHTYFGTIDISLMSTVM